MHSASTNIQIRNMYTNEEIDNKTLSSPPNNGKMQIKNNNNRSQENEWIRQKNKSHKCSPQDRITEVTMGIRISNKNRFRDAKRPKRNQMGMRHKKNSWLNLKSLS